jgi:hypothetical protein
VRSVGSASVSERVEKAAVAGEPATPSGSASVTRAS